MCKTLFVSSNTRHSLGIQKIFHRGSSSPECFLFCCVGPVLRNPIVETVLLLVLRVTGNARCRSHRALYVPYTRLGLSRTCLALTPAPALSLAAVDLVQNCASSSSPLSSPVPIPCHSLLGGKLLHRWPSVPNSPPAYMKRAEPPFGSCTSFSPSWLPLWFALGQGCSRWKTTEMDTVVYGLAQASSSSAARPNQKRRLPVVPVYHSQPSSSQNPAPEISRNLAAFTELTELAFVAFVAFLLFLSSWPSAA